MTRPTHLQIAIPEPCHVPWDGMSPVDNERRHCSSCDKVITNFSAMSDDELMLYFKHSRQNLCGVFSNEQLNRRIKLLPEKTRKARWWRMIALLSLSLFSKSAKAQYVDYINGDRQSHPQIDSVINPVTLENKPDSAELAKTKTDSVNISSEPLTNNVLPADSIIANVLTLTNPIMNGPYMSGGIYLMTMGDVCISTPFIPFEPLKGEECTSETEPYPAIWHLEVWDILHEKWRTWIRKKEKFDNPGELKALTSLPEKPEPEKPALPSSTQISGILPPEDRKIKRS